MDYLKQPLNYKKLAVFLITLIGVISGVLTITAYFQEKKPLLAFEIISNTNVLDINANVSKLDITYSGASLKSNHQNLRIFVIRIKNIGNDNILKEFYDDNDPVGLFIKNGKIIEMPEIINASNGYLKKNLLAKLDSNGKLLFNNLIMEANQSYTLKILVLHPSKAEPDIQAMGKIAGQNQIPINNIQQTAKEKSIWKEAFYGSVEAQSFRLLSYGIIFLLILIGGIIAVVNGGKWIEKMKKVRLVKEFKQTEGYKYHKMNDAIFTRFVDSQSTRLLRKFNTILKNDKVLQQEYQKRIDEKEKIGDMMLETSNEGKNIVEYFDYIDEMIDDGLILKTSAEIVINQTMKITLVNFLKFLETKGYRLK